MQSVDENRKMENLDKQKCMLSFMFEQHKQPHDIFGSLHIIILMHNAHCTLTEHQRTINHSA